MRRGDCIIYIFIIKGCFVVVSSLLGVSIVVMTSAVLQDVD
jgi:Zn-dependent membrane protease YugP